MSELLLRPSFLTDVPFHYCPGCTHGIAHRITAEALGELFKNENVIGIAPVGCAVFAYKYFKCDMFEAAHGRAPAVATGIKRCLKNKIVFTYQGDGDLAGIGMAETIHAAARNENITVIFINNGIYGMTGGQMAPTTPAGQKTTTSQEGRDTAMAGSPIKMCELLSALDGPAYIERVSLHDAKNVLNAKRAIKKAFQNQADNKGFSLIEVLSTCPTNFKQTPQKALDYLKETMTKTFPLGVYKDKSGNVLTEVIQKIIGVIRR